MILIMKTSDAADTLASISQNGTCITDTCAVLDKNKHLLMTMISDS
jgi:hypothetical protein